MNLRRFIKLVAISLIIALCAANMAISQTIESIVEEKLVIQYNDEILFIKWDPKADRIAVLGQTLTIDIFDSSNGDKVAELATAGGIPSGMVWSPDGSKIATVSIFGNLQIWDIANQKSITELNIEEITDRTFFPQFTTDLAWHPLEAKIAVAGGSNRGVSVWDFSEDNYFTESAEISLPSSTTYISGVAWSDDGNTLVVSSPGCEIAYVDPLNLQPTQTLDYDLLPYRGPIAPTGQFTQQYSQLFDLSPDNSLLVQFCNASTNDIFIRDMQTGVIVGQFQNLDSRTFAVEWSPNGDLLATVHEDGQLRLWNMVEFELLEVVKAHSEAATSVTWSPDGTELATASLDSTVRIWDISHIEE